MAECRKPGRDPATHRQRVRERAETEDPEHERCDDTAHAVRIIQNRRIGILGAACRTT
jgi:hypothetical protein